MRQSFLFAAFLSTALWDNGVLGFSVVSKTPGFHHTFTLGSSKKDAEQEEDCPCCNVKQKTLALLTPRFARITAPIRSVALAMVAPLSLDLQLKREASFENSLKRFYPNALPSSVAAAKLTSKFFKPNRFTPSNTLFGTSLCSDEINCKQNTLNIRLQKSLIKKTNGAFALGGLGGLPFVGVSGMRAFLSHCPSQGKVVILYGPHIGITRDGVIGKVERVGQEKASSACGAALGAYQAIEASNKNPDHGVIDFQEDYIISKLRPEVATYKGDTAPVFVTDQMFAMIEAMLLEELEPIWQDPQFWDKIQEVVLVGGITVNRGQTEGEKEDFFELRTLDTFTKGENRPERVGFLSSVYGLDQSSLSP